jgi:hypothetical protein
VAHVWREVVGLVEHLVRFSHDIALLFEILRQTIETVAQAVRAAGAELAAIDDMWAPGGNRLEPVRSG